MAGPTYRGLRLDGPLAEFHRAVDRLRWDTDHHHAAPSSVTPAPPSRPEPDPGGQARLALPA